MRCVGGDGFVDVDVDDDDGKKRKTSEKKEVLRLFARLG